MKRFTFSFPYPVLPWKLIALLALALVLFIFLWMIFFGPLSRCDRLWEQHAQSSKSMPIYNELKAHGGVKANDD